MALTRTSSSPAAVAPATSLFSPATWALGTKLTAAIVALVLVTLLATTLFSSQRVSSTVDAQTKTTLSNKATIIGQLTGLFLQDKLNQLQTITLAPDVYKGTAARNASYKGADAANVQLVKQLDTRWRAAKDNDPLLVKVLSTDPAVNVSGEALADLVRRYPEQTEVFTTDRFGATVTSTGRLSDYYQADEGWWTAAWNEGKGAVYVSDPEFDDSAKINAVLISAPIKNDTDQNIGVIRTTLNVDALFGLLKDQTFGEKSEALLVNGDGLILASSVGTVVKDSKVPDSVKQLFSTKQAGFIQTNNSDGTNAVFAVAPAAFGSIKPNWFVVLRQDSAVAFASATETTQIGLLAALVAAILAIIAAFFLARSITKPIGDLSTAAARLAEGDFDVQVPVTSRDEVGRLAATFNYTADRLKTNAAAEAKTASEGRLLQKNVSNFLDVAMDISEGDLTKRGLVTEDALGNVVDSINLMVQELGQTLGGVRLTAGQVTQSANAVLSSTDQISLGATQTTTVAQQVAGQVQSVTAALRQVAQGAQSSAQAAQQALSAAQAGQHSVNNTLVGMQSIRDEVLVVAERIRGLGQRSQEISEVVRSVGRISSQVNLLALSASLEAAGAGVAGERFGVVAQEVQQLAESSAQATTRIQQLVQGVQREITDVIALVQGSTKQVDDGYVVAQRAGERLEEIQKIVQQSSQLAQAISNATRNQVVGVEQMNKAVQSIATVASETQNNVQQGRETAENLSVLAQKLTESLSRFKIN
jgi:methyl-accepting chemotaxis protein